jgi:hypothetical protein
LVILYEYGPTSVELGMVVDLLVGGGGGGSLIVILAHLTG